MPSLYKNLLRPALFALSNDPETAHELAVTALREFGHCRRIAQVIGLCTQLSSPHLSQRLFGKLWFPSPVSIADGFDKNGEAESGLVAVTGAGASNVGTVTLFPQDGHPRPRIHRFPKDKALINRMGFPNRGAKRVAYNLHRNGHPGVPRGVNIGKSACVSADKPGDLDKVIEDYLACLHLVIKYADYLVVNVSSPNTPGLRALQGKVPLMALLKAIVAAVKAYAEEHKEEPKPVLVKLTSDLSDLELAEALDAAAQAGVAGFVATNTTKSRQGLSKSTNVEGGLSGKPLRIKALQMVHQIRKHLPDHVIIGVGGIFTADHAWHMLEAGANLVQLYTGFIYEGPGLIYRINRELDRRLAKRGMKISDLSWR